MSRSFSSRRSCMVFTVSRSSGIAIFSSALTFRMVFLTSRASLTIETFNSASRPINCRASRNLDNEASIQKLVSRGEKYGGCSIKVVSTTGNWTPITRRCFSLISTAMLTALERLDTRSFPMANAASSRPRNALSSEPWTCASKSTA